MDKPTNNEIKRLKAKLVEHGLKPEHLPADVHFEIAARGRAELVEDVSRRASNRKVFIHRDIATGQSTGQITVLSTIGSIHYQEGGEGDWQDCDTTLREVGNDLKVRNVSLPVTMPKNSVGSVIYHFGLAKTLVIKSLDIKPSLAERLADNKVIYRDAYTSVDLKRIATPNFIKEVYVLKAVGHPASFQFNLTASGGLGFSLEDGCLVLRDGIGIVAISRPPSVQTPELETRQCFYQLDSDVLTLTLPNLSGLSYPLEIDPTIDKQIAAGGDDSRRYSGSDGFRSDQTAGHLGYVDTSTHYHCHGCFRWTGVTIEGTITASTVELYLFEIVGTALLKIHGVDEDNPAAPTSAAEFDADPLTTAEVDWDGSWTDDDWNISPSLNSIFQELVDSYTISNEAVMVQIKNDGGTTQRFVYPYHYEHDSALAAKLSITYTLLVTLAGALTSAGAMTWRRIVTLAGAITSTGAIVKKTLIAKVGGLTSAGAIIKKGFVAKVGGLTSSGIAQGIYIQCITLAGAFGAWRISGLVIPIQINIKSLGGTLSSSGITIGVLLILKSLSGAITSAGAIIKKTLLTRVGAITSAGTIVKKGFVAKVGALTSAGAIVRKTLIAKVGALTSSGATQTIRTRFRALTGAITSTGAIVKKTLIAKVGGLTSAGAIVWLPTKALSGALTSGGTLARSIYRMLIGTLSSSGVVIAARLLLKALAGALTTAGTAITKFFRGTRPLLVTRHAPHIFWRCPLCDTKVIWFSAWTHLRDVHSLNVSVSTDIRSLSPIITEEDVYGERTHYWCPICYRVGKMTYFHTKADLTSHLRVFHA